jgi:hypothetical protein
MTFQSSGEIATTTDLDPEDAIDNGIKAFVADGWETQEDRGNFAILKKGPGGGTGCLLLFLFFPIGLAYLLTDWGRGRLTIRAAEGEDKTHVLIQWHNTGIRSEVEDFVHWLESQPGR